MPNGWTGGQYSVYRVVLAGALATHCGVSGWIVGVPLALGIADRLVAGAGAVGMLALAVSLPSDWPVVVALLALHAATPPRPYGAWSARGRVDPDGGWRLPAGVHLAARVVLVLCLLFDRGESWWVIPGVLLSFDPAWIRPKREGAAARLFYDGDCGLCHAAVRFVLAEDRDGAGFRFAPLASESFARLGSPELRARLPDSIVLALPDGSLLVRSAATLEIGERLGGLWRVIARAARLVPERWRDRLYDAIARNRKRWVRKPDDACPLLTPELRARFD